jgi:GNAT superfamily N-acetyltransferase
MEIVCVQTAEHLHAVRELYLEYYYFIRQHYGVDMGYEYFQAEMAALPGAYAPPAGRLLLAQDGVTAMACAGLRQITTARGELKRLYVRSAYRRQGVGRALVATLISAAREIGYRQLRVHTAEFLTAALGLYRELGFRETPSSAPAEVLMELLLG